MSKLLINEYPLQVLPTLATYIGLNEAIVLQQIHYWLNNPKVGTEKDGRKWVRNSLDEWIDDNFPFWDKSTLRRALANLKSDGFIADRSDLNRMKIDRTLWYTINYQSIEGLSKPVDRIKDRRKKRRESSELRANVQNEQLEANVQNEHTKCSKRTLASVQNEHTNNQRLPETTSEITTTNDQPSLICQPETEPAIQANDPSEADSILIDPITTIQTLFLEKSKIDPPSNLFEQQEWDDDVRRILTRCGNNPALAIEMTGWAITKLSQAKTKSGQSYTIASPGSLYRTITQELAARERAESISANPNSAQEETYEYIY